MEIYIANCQLHRRLFGCGQRVRGRLLPYNYCQLAWQGVCVCASEADRHRVRSVAYCLELLVGHLGYRTLLQQLHNQRASPFLIDNGGASDIANATTTAGATSIASGCISIYVARVLQCY